MSDKDYWKIYNEIESWIKFADAKAVAFIGIIGVMLTIFIKELFCILTLPLINPLKILSIISILLLIGSLICSILCLYPRKSEYDDKNAFYYKSISKHFSEDQYSKYLKELDKKDYNDQLGVQIYQLSQVCDKKYFYVEWSLNLFISGIGFLILLLLFDIIL